MPAALSTPEAERSLAMIVEDVFTTMTGMRVWRTERMPEPVGALCGASVGCVGPMPCSVEIAFSASLAAAVTHRLMPGDHSHPWEEDVRDAVGELVNIVGGNLKGLMPDETLLSIPRVLEDFVGDSESRAQMPAIEPVLAMCFAAEEGSCKVSVYPGEAPAALMA